MQMPILCPVVRQKAVSQTAREVLMMAFILSVYVTVLTLAIWQETQSANEMRSADKGC